MKTSTHVPAWVNDSNHTKKLKQARADNEAAIARLRAEGRKLIFKSASQRTKEEAERIDAIDRELTALTESAVEITASLAEAEKYLDEEMRRISDAATAREIVRPVGRRYAEMFGSATLSAGGWNNREEFLAVLHQGLSDVRLMAAATVGVGSEGGFSVPTQFTGQWLDESLENEIVRPLAEVWPMTSNSRQIPGVDGLNHSSTLYGGFTGSWVGEGQELTLEVMKMRLMTLVAHKLGILSEVSNELVRDGVGYDAQLSKAIVKAIGWFFDHAFLNGTGAGQPLGVINADCTVTVSKESGQAASTIVYENLTKMFARMPAELVGESVWVANQATIPQLAAVTIPIGTGGSHVPVMSESDGQFRILTRPVKFTEKVPTLGTKGDIGLYAFSQYAIGMRQEMSLDKSQHVGFTRDTSHYRGLLRADGRPKWPASLTPKNGDALSPFVVLATRS